MKLSQLFEADQPESFSNYIARLHREGIMPLGNGTNAYVFQHPTMSHVAVKVFMDDDLGYREFLEFCIKNPHNKYLPRVLDTEDFAHDRRSKYVAAELHANWNSSRSDTPPYSIAFLEKLTKVDNTKYDELTDRLCAIAGTDDINLPRLGLKGWTAIAANNSDEDLQQLAEFFVKAMGEGHKPDVGNRKNFMMRGEQIVFVDALF